MSLAWAAFSNPRTCWLMLMRRLKMDPLVLCASRQQLVRAGLIAYEEPLYQVLSVEPAY